MQSAVLVIDVQQGLCEGEAAAFDCEGTISRINLVLRKARRAGVPVVFIQHEAKDGHLQHGTAAWQLAHGLKVNATDKQPQRQQRDETTGADGLKILFDNGAAQARPVLGPRLSPFCPWLGAQSLGRAAVPQDTAAL